MATQTCYSFIHANGSVGKTSLQNAKALPDFKQNSVITIIFENLIITLRVADILLQ